MRTIGERPTHVEGNSRRMSKPPPIANVPFEILCKIFALMNDTGVFSTDFRTSALSAVQDLNAILHTCSHFRDIALDSPQLWTAIPYLNNVGDALVDLMLQRSFPLPFSLAFLEDETLPTTHPVWGTVLNDVGRLGHLRIEVANPLQGTITKFFLTLPVPALQRCAVTFQGSRNVHLELDGTFYAYPFSHHAPELETLNLTNCYISPGFFQLPKLSKLSIRYFGPPEEQDAAVALKDFAPSTHGQFTTLRELVIWDCFSPQTFWRDLPDDPVVFPILERLVVATPLAACEKLADLLRYPTECTVSVNLTLPPMVEASDAQSVALASSRFIPQAERFDMCRIVLAERYSPYIRLVRPGHRSYISFRFILTGVAFSISTTQNFFIRALNCLAFPLSLPDSPIEPFDVFSFQLWDALATTLQHNLVQVTKLHAVFALEDDLLWSVSPSYPLALFPRMPNALWISAEPPTVFTNRPFFHGAANAFPDLQHITVKLSKDLTSSCLKQAKAALSDFLAARAWDGREVGKASFIVSSTLARRYGFAENPTGFKAMVSSYGSNFPLSTELTWVEKK